MGAKKRSNYAPANGRSAEELAYERFAEMMIEKIKSIKEDWKMPWFTEGTLQWPRNFSGRRYNGMNALMLLLLCEEQKYKIPVFMTFNQVSGLNYKKGKGGEREPLRDNEGNPLPLVSVLKGSKSFPVFLTTFTVVHSEMNFKISYDEYKKLSVDEQREYDVYPKLQVYNEFNIEQTNIQEVRPELYEELKNKYVRLPPELSATGYSFPTMDEIIRNNEWLCPIHVEHQNEAYYSPSRDEIMLPEKSQFYEGELFYGTAFHEMIHSTGAKDRLDRHKPNTPFGSPEYIQEELVAELGSALVMQQYGLTKTIKEESCAYLKGWLKELGESPEFIKNVLTDVKRATAMVGEKLEVVNKRLMESGVGNNKEAPLLVSKMPHGVISEIHLVDSETCDAVYDIISHYMNVDEQGQNMKVHKNTDNVVWMRGNCVDEVMELLSSELDAESYDKIVTAACFYEGHPVEFYQYSLPNRFLSDFENRRVNPDWLKEQGLEGDIQWCVSQMRTNGHFEVAANSNGKCKAGVLDYKGNVFLPFVGIDEKYAVEGFKAYWDELRNRLLNGNEKVDEFGRISFCSPSVVDKNTQWVSREILIDGEAKAVFVSKPDDGTHLNFILELGNSEFLKFWSTYNGSMMYNAEKDIYEISVDSLDRLFEWKDKVYPVCVINEGINERLEDYVKRHSAISHYEVADNGAVKETFELCPGLLVFKNASDLWGLKDSQNRTLLNPRWCRLEEQFGGGVSLKAFVRSNGELASTDALFFKSEELVMLADRASRLSNVRIEERGEGKEKWLAADIDGEPVLGEKVSPIAKTAYEEGSETALGIATQHFVEYFTRSPEREEVRSMVRV